ncbi:transposase-like protein [Rhodococcus percolatus]|nr:transposase-like protein [Rhodococcus opacus]MBP2207443.1 transposase-like protein [Rhodococcus opacus]GLK39224.1 hypothetical protein GCM10017611_60940 [Rhodococcus wratislaviensis]
MTTAHDIDLHQFLPDRLTDASPNLLRSLLATIIDALMRAEADALCGAGYVQCGTPTRAGTLDVAIPSCGPARTSRTGCCSAANAPRGR